MFAAHGSWRIGAWWVRIDGHVLHLSAPWKHKYFSERVNPQPELFGWRVKYLPPGKTQQARSA